MFICLFKWASYPLLSFTSCSFYLAFLSCRFRSVSMFHVRTYMKRDNTQTPIDFTPRCFLYIHITTYMPQLHKMITYVNCYFDLSKFFKIFLLDYINKFYSFTLKEKLWESKHESLTQFNCVCEVSNPHSTRVEITTQVLLFLQIHKEGSLHVFSH